MPKPATDTVVVGDASVLIDYAEVDRDILRLYSLKVRRLVVARPVLDKIDQLTDDECRSCAIDIVAPSAEQLLEAGTERGALSFDDRVCILLARDKRWVVATADKRMRSECDRLGISALWGLELMLELHRKGHITRARAIRTAQSIHEANPIFIGQKIVEEFVRKLEACAARAAPQRTRRRKRQK